MLEKLLKEALQRELDQWSGGKYSLDIEIQTREVYSRTNPSEVSAVYPVLVYLVSCAGMNYKITEELRELNSQSSVSVSCGQDANGEHWRLEFPSASRLYHEATDYFKNYAFELLLEEDE